MRRNGPRPGTCEGWADKAPKLGSSNGRSLKRQDHPDEWSQSTAGLAFTLSGLCGGISSLTGISEHRVSGLFPSSGNPISNLKPQGIDVPHPLVGQRTGAIEFCCAVFHLHNSRCRRYRRTEPFCDWFALSAEKSTIFNTTAATTEIVTAAITLAKKAFIFSTPIYRYATFLLRDRIQIPLNYAVPSSS